MNLDKNEPRYYSHLLYYPQRKPFDIHELCWPSFIGEFAAPVLKEATNTLYWFTHYGLFARFRVLTSNYDTLGPRLEALRDNLGLLDKGEEKRLTLQEDLGSGRFIGPNSKTTPEARAKAVLRCLTAGADLMIESVVQRGDGYWEFETNGDPSQNPISDHRFSVVHLFHNMMDSKARVYSYTDANGQAGVLSYYYYLYARRKGLSVVSSQHHDILM